LGRARLHAVLAVPAAALELEEIADDFVGGNEAFHVSVELDFGVIVPKPLSDGIEKVAIGHGTSPTEKREQISSQRDDAL
jgi:hypothetical protein